LKKLILSIWLVGAVALAVVPVTTPKIVSFQWSPNAADFGGLSTNEYYTNIFVRLLGVTNCTIPTDLWPVTTQWQASTFPSVDGVHWTNQVVNDGVTRFYLVSVANGNGGASPFSSVAPWVPVPPPGTSPQILNP